MPAKRAKFKVEEVSDTTEPTVPEVPSEKTVVEEVPEQALPSNPTDIEKETPSFSQPVTSDWLKDVKPDTSKEVEKGSGFNIKIVLFLIILMLIIGAVVGGVLYYKKGVNSPSEEPNKNEAVPVTVIPTEVVSPTKAATAEIAKKDLIIQVLNGSGKVGEAGVVKSILTKDGYSDKNISTGNASSYDFKDTEVSLKENVSDATFENIKKILGDKYNVVKATKAVASDSKSDVVITVGATK